MVTRCGLESKSKFTLRAPGAEGSLLLQVPKSLKERSHVVGLTREVHRGCSLPICFLFHCQLLGLQEDDSCIASHPISWQPGLYTMCLPAGALYPQRRKPFKRWVWRVHQGRRLINKDVRASICLLSLHFQVFGLWYMIKREILQ